MVQRFFKSTNGQFTVFRASRSRVYQSAWMTTNEGSSHAPRVINLGFSAKPAYPGFDWPVEEIVKSEYETLVALKNSRLKAAARDSDFGDPGNNWVSNAALDAWLRSQKG